MELLVIPCGYSYRKIAITIIIITIIIIMPSSILGQLSLTSVVISSSSLPVMSQFCYFCPSIKAANALLSAVQNLGYCRFGYQAIHVFQYFSILPTRRCSATRLKHSISAGVILHLPLTIMFQVSKRDDAGQICQHSATIYCTCSNSNATKTTTTKEYFWHIIGLEGAYPSTKKWVENSLGQCKGTTTTRAEGLRKATKNLFQCHTAIPSDYHTSGWAG
jgi:hypothetical protein